MHLIADRLEQAVALPVVHIATATAAAIESKGLKKVGLLGTTFTMELDFFKDKLVACGIEVLIPNEEADRAFIHDTIFEELGKNIFNPATKQRYLAIIDQLVANGAEGIVLGCTEMPLLIRPEDVSVPNFDTVALHAAAGVSFMLN